MKVFISWSGERSRILAESLRSWLTGVINAVEPWISSNDINPGTRWGLEIAGELEKTRYGIICVTTDNINSPWLMFEAGALSKQIEKSRVVPLLLDIKPSDIKGPLAQFQSIQVTEDGIKKLITGINLTVNEAKERGLDDAVLAQSFNLWWPKLAESLKGIPLTVATNAKKEERSEKDIIEETLVLVRDIKRRLTLISNPKKSSAYSELPPPPDNFPDGWDTEWQPSIDAYLDIDDQAKAQNKTKKQ